MVSAALVGAAVTYARCVRPRLLGWGASPEESAATLPGDELMSSADVQATRAITVRSPVAAVRPWIAQMGQGRGGLDSYDALENLFGCEMHSAERLVDEWQDVAVGDPFRLHPAVALRVARVDPGRSLVLRGAVPLSETAAPPYDFSWAFVLDAAVDGSTRLVVRERYRYTRRWGPLLVEPIQLVSFVMSAKMLRGIRDRAEGRPAARARLAFGPTRLSDPGRH